MGAKEKAEKIRRNEKAKKAAVQAAEKKMKAELMNNVGVSIQKWRKLKAMMPNFLLGKSGLRSSLMLRTYKLLAWLGTQYVWRLGEVQQTVLLSLEVSYLQTDRLL